MGSCRYGLGTVGNSCSFWWRLEAQSCKPKGEKNLYAAATERRTLGTGTDAFYIHFYITCWIFLYPIHRLRKLQETWHQRIQLWLDLNMGNYLDYLTIKEVKWMLNRNPCSISSVLPTVYFPAYVNNSKKVIVYYTLLIPWLVTLLLQLVLHLS